LERERIALSIERLAKLGRQRDFSLPRFHRALDSIARTADRNEVLRKLLTEWTGIPHGERDARERWEEVERVVRELKAALGGPVSLQTALVHCYHTVHGALREPRIVSERELAVLRVNAITDPLTGLYNRRFLLDHLNREIARAERSEGIVSIALLDLKGFKAVNDHFGHPMGDAVLVRTARIIRDLLRAVDAGCRWGGDEFVVVLPSTDMFSAFTVAERIRSKLVDGALPAGSAVQVGLHYGVASYPADGKTVDFLLKVADLRLYQCREQTGFSGEERRHYPRFIVNDTNVRLGRSGGQRRAWSAPLLDVSFGGLAFRARRSDRFPSRTKGELFRLPLERRPVRIRTLNSAPLPGGTVRVGCAYV
jgi:diguanylate cyclase (GGDEF)-like protein